MTIPNEMAPAIVGAVFGIAMWLYALQISRKSRAYRRQRDTPPAE